MLPLGSMQPIERLLMVPGLPMKADIVLEFAVGLQGLLNGLLRGSWES